MRTVLAALVCCIVPLGAVPPATLAGSAGTGGAGIGRPEPVDPATRETERAALLGFYEALGGVDWIQRDNWGSDEPVGHWHGVETDKDGRVVLLKIYDNNLEGALSPAICDLERLHTLHLSFNKISGALPDALGNCRALKNLWLKGNRLTGSLPASIAVLPALEYLDVHANDLSGPLPDVWHTSELRIFRGEDNRISGALPAGLFRQGKLEQVFLHNNAIEGVLPSAYAPDLQSLLLMNNRISGPIPPEIGELDGLTDLRLNDNRLTGPIPESLGRTRALQVLRLDGNALSGPVPQGLADRLTVFDVSGNPGIGGAR